MKELSISEICSAIDGKILCGRPGMTVSKVSRDSREVDDDTIFFALIGQNQDGHSFIKDVVAGQCTALVVSDPEALKQVSDEYVTAILVDDTTKALQRLAAWYLRQLNVTIIGVTGSVGKTTTKDLLAAACSQKYNTKCTQGNYNNHIGLPLTVLDFDENTQVGVLEMGMDKYGEIDFLANLARPHIAVITTIGSAHMEFFGSRENIMKAKMEITNYLEPSDILVINSDGDLLNTKTAAGDYRLISCGPDDKADFSISNIEDKGKDGMEFDLSNMWMTQRFSIPVMGVHNVRNAALAAAAACQLSITMKVAARGMYMANITGGRLAFKKNDKKEIDIIDDTYNASPEAMRAAIDQLMAAEGQRKVAILGDMYELGDTAPQIHESVGRYAKEKGVDLVLGVGGYGVRIAEGAGDIGQRFQNKKELIKSLHKIIKAGDTVLVKASRGMALEEVVDQLMK